MFGDYVLKQAAAEYNNRILLIDDEGLEEATHYSADFQAHGFEVVHYTDDLTFRLEYEDKLKSSDDKLLVLAHTGSYIPYDLHRRLRVYLLSLDRLFPKLNVEVLKARRNLDLGLLCLAYRKNFDDLRQRKQTEDFLRQKVDCPENVAAYLKQRYYELLQSLATVRSYRDWFALAEIKAKIDTLSTEYRLDFDTSQVNRAFRDYVLKEFGKLSTEMNKETPVLVSRAMEYMHDHSDKFVVIVMDGMSEFDWSIIAKSFHDLLYEQSAAFAMIPSTTSISRQCLLSNKTPGQLMEPWKQSKEKQEFVACARSMGYTDNQIGYERGYDAQFGSFVKCGAVIINDVDDMVHAQHQGRLGMMNDIGVLSDQHKLADMTKRFLAEGFDVYITADHGNTPCTGLGKLMGTGVETETKSRRMIVLQNFADKDGLMQKYGLIEYPKYYMNKALDYLICDVGDSFDAKGEAVMTHGGITIDEVIVPFIKIKAVK
ncbi:PglZ domain-containing protein [Pectinatus frisingensis]|uniref:PglZ domain-containing protein n=1 Tax=Pectinatus frisingensis TaxID=865 RepID=UPI0018C534BA|nr:PglZ domain-containing protein [Pectinatus frisingensis]